MRLFILLGLAVACVAYSVAQQVSGGKNYQPRVGITNSFHDGSTSSPEPNGFIGGMRTNEWANNVQVGTSITMIGERAAHQLFGAYEMRGAHVWALGNTVIKLKVFRPIGTNVWNFVGDVGTYALTAGTNYLTFTSGYRIQEGDGVAIWNSNAATILPVKNRSQAGRYSANEQSGSTYTFTTTLDYSLNMALYGKRPTLVFAGDSIITPHPYGFGYGVQYAQFIGSPSNSATWKLQNEVGYSNTFVNVAYPDKTYADVATTQITLATNTEATTLYMAAGVNDVATARTWAQVLANLNTVRSIWTNQLIVQSILPWTSGSDANALTIRTWNTNLSVWCATSSATYLNLHAAFGTNRASTSQPDDLKPEYDLDGIHHTTLGRYVWATNVAPYMPAYIP